MESSKSIGMTPQQVGVWVFLVASVGAYLWYLAVVLPQLAANDPSTINWVNPALWAIGASVAVGLLCGIIVGIVTRGDVRDVRDREIDRLGERVGSSFGVLGASTAFVLTFWRVEWFWIGNVIYLGFLIAGVVASITKLIAYRYGGFQQW